MTASCLPDWTRFWQLQQADPYGGLNCSAYALAAGLWFDSCGTIRVTGRQVRAMSDEATPDPRSPGLRHEQLAAVALRLGVRLDVRRGMPWEDVEQARDEGHAVALAVSYEPIRLSSFSGQRSFRGNHELLLVPSTDFDPLADGRLSGGTRVFRGPAKYPEALLRRAAGELVLRQSANGQVLARLGQGRAYAAIFPHKHPVVVPAGPVWAPDIQPDIVKAYSAAKVAAKLRALGVTSYGKVINYSDLEAGLRKRGIDFQSSVQLIDVRALMKAGTGR